MAALPPYIPSKDAALSNWLTNFSALITASPASYGLLAADATNISTVVAAFNAAYAMVTSASTKTPQTVSAKNTARVTALAVVRPYSQAIALNAGVSSANKIALGLNPRTSTPAPISAPVQGPSLTIQSAGHLTAIVRYRDPVASPSVKAKPYGVKQCAISYAVSATPITDATALGKIALATKSPLTLAFDPADAGKTAYMAARWVVSGGRMSPFGGIVSVTVPAIS